MTRDWLQRYEAGHRPEIWRELRQLGAAVREPEIRAEAQLVCDAMALRARRNIEMIVGQLAQDGFRFHTNDDAQTPVVPHVPPSSTAAQHADWLDQTFGPLPLTLLSWVRMVGDVWLVGTHPKWSTSSEADPLVIQIEGLHYPESSARDFFNDAWEAWRDDENDPNREPFVLELAPDRYHKANTSGGAPHGIQLPDACADGLFRAQASMPFVDYLNWVFHRAGFPYIVGGSAEEWEVTSKRGRELLPL